MTNECRAGNVRSSRLRKLIPPRGSIFTALCRVGVGSIPHLYSRNLTPDKKTGLPEGGHTFEDFKKIIRHGMDFDHLHPSCIAPGTPANCLPFPFNGDLLQVMPWPTYANMTDRDLLAIYTYLSAIPCRPGPLDLDPKLYEPNVCE